MIFLEIFFVLSHKKCCFPRFSVFPFCAQFLWFFCVFCITENLPLYGKRKNSLRIQDSNSQQLVILIFFFLSFTLCKLFMSKILVVYFMHLLQARVIFQKGTNVAYIKVEDLASVWCEWAEMELRHEYVQLHSLILLPCYLFSHSFPCFQSYISFIWL